MSTVKSLYGSSGQAITCTITSLANAGQRQSTAVDNTSNLYLDALVALKVKTGTGTSAASTVNVYAYGTADGGTDYSDGASGTDGSITLTAPPNMRLIGQVNCPANTTTFEGGPFSVAAAFGGILPDHWGIVVENTSGGTLDASVGSAWYQGIQQSVV
jgi:hypothetical protein